MNRNKATALRRWLQKAHEAGFLSDAEAALIPQLSGSKLRLIANEVTDRRLASERQEDVNVEG